MSSRNPRMIDGCYCGNLTPNTIQAIRRVRDMDDKEETLPRFEDTIFLFPEDLVIKALEAKMSVRQYIKENKVPYEQYKAKLRGYQTTGVAFMYLSPRSIIGDGVGRGKTVEICALLNVLRAEDKMTRFIMAVEKSALNQTVMELLSKTGMNVVGLPSESAKLDKVLHKQGIDWAKVDGVVVTHSALSSNVFLSWLAESKEITDAGVIRNTLFNTFIVDESAVLKNHKNKIYSNTAEICKMMTRIHFMNATVFETSIMDIYNQIDMLDGTILPSRSRITERFCVQERREYWVKRNGVAEKKFAFNVAGYKNQAEFKEQLKLFYMARHFEDDVNKYTLVKVEATEEQMRAIRAGERYQEVLNCPSLIVNEKYKIPFTRDRVPKLNTTLNLCEKYKGKKIMIYCFYREAQDVLKQEVEKLGMTAEILNGDIIKVDDRQSMIDRFNSGETQVIITNVKKSLNLYNGEVCIIMTMESNPAKLEQIRGRIDRHVDDAVKEYFMLVAIGTPEYRLFDKKLKSRQAQSKELTVDARSAVDYFLEGEVIHAYVDDEEI